MSACLELMGQASKLGPRDAGRLLRQGEGLAEDVRAAESLLQRVVDWDGHFSEGHFDAHLVHVQRGVDRRLDGLRQQYLNIETHLSDIASLEKQRLLGHGKSPQRAVDTVLFHYFPQLGFHASLPNPIASGGEVDADGMELLKRKGCIPQPAPDWSYQFAGGSRLFYKCDMARRLDTEIGDLVVQARDAELEILAALLERLRRLEARLRKAAQLLAEVDVIQAFGSASLQYKWTRPKLSASKPGLLHIVRGRHPLVEAMSSHHGFVPNSTQIGLDSEEVEYRVQVVTGANLSGKSVYLKQVGLIAYMAHIGCYVPADEAELGLCDFIFSRIQSCEGATAGCSTFTLDLCQLSLALNHATASSLVLMDEFGKGTRAADGVALLAATVEYFCRWSNGPKVVITTHFTEIFRMGLVSQSEPFLRVSHLRVLPPDEDAAVTEDGRDAATGSVAYLYQIADGCSEKSFGLECAAQAGMDPSILERAATVLRMIESGEGGRLGQETQEAEGEELTDQQLAVCKMIVERFRVLDTDDETASAAFLAFVASKADELPFDDRQSCLLDEGRVTMRRERCLAATALLAIAAGISSGAAQPEEAVKVFQQVISDADTAHFQRLLQKGQKSSCCGYWADRAAVRLQQFVAGQLEVSRRHLGDVHFDNITAVRALHDESSWSGVAVLYLDGDAQVQLQHHDHQLLETMDVTAGSLIQVPEGAVLLHTKPLQVAWTRIRAVDSPVRGFFEFYLASWVQRNFVTPYDTASQRKFFRTHTRHPRYWHGFIWSFVGTFCTVFACLPLAWFGVQMLANLHGRDDPVDECLSPTLLPRVGRVGKGSRCGGALGSKDHVRATSPWSLSK
ncbi:MSH5 [Symbiodinium sp. CCMP2592]|nr:MSH5 [Symbiodinium sp. CCMP2592]